MVRALCEAQTRLVERMKFFQPYSRFYCNAKVQKYDIIPIRKKQAPLTIAVFLW
jgi:hypothetical protein